MHSALPMTRIRSISGRKIWIPALLMFGCGNSGNFYDGDGGTNPLPDGAMQIAPAGGLVLTVQSARSTTLSGILSVDVAITLANGAGAPAVSLNPVLFQMQNAAGVLVVGSSLPHGGWVNAPGCDPTLSIAGGGAYSCALTFLPAGNAPPSKIIYRTPAAIAGVGNDQRTASASLTIEPCTTCGSDCTYLDVDPNNCGQCGTAVDPSGQTSSCKGGKAVCADPSLTACSMASGEPVSCTNVNVDSGNCGQCGTRVVDGAVCENGSPVCTTVGQTPCAKGCANLQSDETSCGACGAPCGAQEFCDRSACIALASITKDGVACSDYCQSIGKQCVDGKSRADWSMDPARSPVCQTGQWPCMTSSYGTTGGYDNRCNGDNFTYATFWCACD